MVVPAVAINLRRLSPAPSDAIILKVELLSVTVIVKGSPAVVAIASSTVSVLPFNCKSKVLAALSSALVDAIESIV